MTDLLASHVPLGTPEMVIIAILVLVLFGAKKLPTFCSSLRRSMSEFRKAKEDFERELHRSLERLDLDGHDLPARDDLASFETSRHKTFRPRHDWRGRNKIVVLMMIICAALLVIALLRSA